MEISDDVAVQAEQTFLNIKAAMEKAGFGLEHIVRVHYILPKAEDFQAAGPYCGNFSATSARRLPCLWPRLPIRA